MHGLHLTADLYDCRCELLWLLDAARTESACLEAVRAAGLQPVTQLCHAFPATPQGPGGFTATVLLSESHLCLHTWPEQLAVTLDVYVCNFGADHSLKAHTLMDTLIALFQPTRAERHALMRGALPPAMPAAHVAPAGACA
jgi:S-adenosylmethionine decarboxylase